MTQGEPKIIQVRDVMTRRVLTVDVRQPLGDAVKLMLDNRISGLPVVSGGAVVGMLTEGDLLRRVELGTGTRHAHPLLLALLRGPGKLASEYAHEHGRSVSEVMSAPVVTIRAEASILSVVQTMNRRNFKRLPVVDRNGRLAGIVTRADILRALENALSNVPTAFTGDDSALSDAILRRLSSESWCPVAAINIAVTDGVVDISGTLTDARERAAVCAAIETLPGVQAVHDHMIVIEPISGAVIEFAPEEPKGSAEPVTG